LGASVATYTNNGSVGTFSDRRLKTNIVPIDGQAALTKIAALKPVLFDWINPDLHDNGAESGGFIAQDVEKVMPHLVSKVNCMREDCKLVNGENAYVLALKPEFNAYVVKAIQELKSLFDTDHDALSKLKADNDSLRAANDNEAAQIEALTARLDALEASHH
jgi:Chaperone of endosialidase